MKVFRSITFLSLVLFSALLMILAPAGAAAENVLISAAVSGADGSYLIQDVPNGVFDLVAVRNTGSAGAPSWNYACLENISIVGGVPASDMNITTKTRNINEADAAAVYSLLDRTTISGTVLKAQRNGDPVAFPGVPVLLLIQNKSHPTGYELAASAVSGDGGAYQFSDVANGRYDIAAVRNTGTADEPVWNYALCGNIDVSSGNPLTDQNLITKTRNINETEAGAVNSLLDRTTVSGTVLKAQRNGDPIAFPDVSVLLVRRTAAADPEIPENSTAEAKTVVIIAANSYRRQIMEALSGLPEKNVSFSFFSTDEIAAQKALDFDLTTADVLILSRVSAQTVSFFRDNLDKAMAGGTVVFNDNDDDTRNNIPAVAGLTDTDELKTAYRIKVMEDYMQNGGAYQENYINVVYMTLHDFCGRADLIAQNAKKLPDSAVYHPDMPENGTDPNGFRTSADAYLEWYAGRTDGGHVYDPERPTIGYVFYKKSYPVNTASIDALIHEFERREVNVIAVYAENNEYTQPYFIDAHGKAVVDAVISSRYMGSMRFDPARLDVPVFNAVTAGPYDQWTARSDPLSSSMTKLLNAEIYGVIDPIVIFSTESVDGTDVAMPVSDQIEWMADRVLAQAALRRTDNADKNVVVMYYNHGGGKDGIGASYLDVVPSIRALLEHMAREGYNIDPSLLADLTDDRLLRTMLTQGYNVGTWAPGELEKLVRTGEAVLIPADTYVRWFDEMIASMPEDAGAVRRQEIAGQWGEAPGGLMVYENESGKYVVIPQINISGSNGSGSVILAPQPSRGRYSSYETLYHDTNLVPNHQYIAFYLWLQHSEAEDGCGADAIVSMGRHGTQEWLPGKENGLSRYDWPALMSGDIPIIYSYVMDGVGEGMTSKRRGNAVIVDHLTPAIISGYTGDYSDLEQQIRHYKNAVMNGDPDLKEKHRSSISRLLASTKLNARFDLTAEDQAALSDDEFDVLLADVSEVLDALKLSWMPYGLHIFNGVPEGQVLAETVDAMLSANSDYRRHVEAAGAQTPDDAALMLLLKMFDDGQSPEEAQISVLGQTDSRLSADLSLAVSYADSLSACSDETGRILKALAGGYISPGVGGDPVTSPHALPSGVNFYSFDQKKVPTKEAWALGRDMADKLLTEYAEEHGQYPSSAAFVLFAGETTRHEGVMEAMILSLLGIEPVWGASGNVNAAAFSIIPADELTIERNGQMVRRPRIDVVMEISGQYRDLYPEKVILLDRAVRLAYEQTDGENYIRDHTKAVLEDLKKKGVENAEPMALARLFGPAPDTYGTGLPAAAGATDSWDGTAALAEFYMNRMSYVYGENVWGEFSKETFSAIVPTADVTLHSRSSSLYGSLDNDDFFQYLGGLNMVISCSKGAPPDSFVLDLKAGGDGKITSLKDYLADEMYARYLNPKWIEGMQKHGYAGAREMEDFLENLWCWEATNPDLVSDNMWQAAYETYFTGENREWFMSGENTAYAYQAMAARMIETSMKGNWNADSETIRSLVSAYAESVAAAGIVCCHHTCGNPDFNNYVSGLLSVPGYVDEKTAAQWKNITEEALGVVLKPGAETGSRSSSGGAGSARILETVIGNDTETRIPAAGDAPDPENAGTASSSEKEGDGAGDEPGLPGNPVSGYQLIPRALQSTSASLQEFLKNPTFSATSLITILFVIAVTAVFFYGYRRKGL